MATPDSLRYVEGELNYLVPMPERPRYYAYDAGPEAPPTNMAHEAHTVRIHDMRPVSSEVALDRQGFALVEQRTAVRDFWDEDEVRRVYYPEAERFIAEKHIGERIKRLRLKKSMGLVELGKHTGLSASFLSQLETGRVVPTLRNLARHFGVPDGQVWQKNTLVDSKLQWSKWTNIRHNAAMLSFLRQIPIASRRLSRRHERAVAAHAGEPAPGSAETAREQGGVASDPADESRNEAA